MKDSEIRNYVSQLCEALAVACPEVGCGDKLIYLDWKDGSARGMAIAIPDDKLQETALNSAIMFHFKLPYVEIMRAHIKMGRDPACVTERDQEITARS